MHFVSITCPALVWNVCTYTYMSTDQLPLILSVGILCSHLYAYICLWTWWFALISIYGSPIHAYACHCPYCFDWLYLWFHYSHNCDSSFWQLRSDKRVFNACKGTSLFVKGKKQLILLSFKYFCFYLPFYPERPK